ncbi:LEAF RUST 10 DISEASE-RESISTANCE LOCUS RECEPTOR-LIKE PROTEIN KINASE-like 1.2 [Carex rostrata]
MFLSFICFASLFFLHPCLSTSCLPLLKPYEEQCNKSLEIKSPFFLINETKNICESAINIKCFHENRTRVYPFHTANYWFSLEKIRYSTNNLIVSDPTLEKEINSSNCGNLLFSLLTPQQFDFDLFSSFSTNIKSFCESPNLSSQSPILDEEYTLNYSATTNKYLPSNCSRKAPEASFELEFSFDDDGSVFLLSAKYSYKFLSQQGCFNQNILGGDYKNTSTNTGKTNRATRKNILIGVPVGIAGLLVLFLICLTLYKHKKLKSISSSSELLTRGSTSDQYFHDLDMTGLQCTQIFSYEELEEATEGFSASKELGDGGFGTVYKGNLRDGRVVAVKRLYKNSYKRTEQFLNEVEILSHVHHPNLVTLYGCTARTSEELLLVYEFVPNGTIADHLHGPRLSENILTWPIRLSIAIETANALSYLHAVEPQIIHRDVKTNNILLDDIFHVKVGDFGLSRLFPLDVTHVSTVPQGTPGYVDPVYHQCYKLTDKSDVYSFGVVLVELISSKPAVDMARSCDEINLANLALNKIQRDEVDELVDPALGFQSDLEVRQMVTSMAKLAFRCLQSARDMRPSMKEVLEVLTVIQNGGYEREKITEISPSKEEAHLLEGEAMFSPNTVISGWMSKFTTPNISS